MFDFKVFEQKVADAKDWLGKEYRALRTGRASPAILDSVYVQAYGSSMPLKQVGNIAVEDARTLRVTAWDAGVVKDIERGIVAADLGVSTVSDGAGVRVMFPQLTTERREQLVRAAKQKLEEARTTVRVARDECWKAIQAQEAEGGMGEDEKFRLKDELQKKVDAGNEALETMFEGKEKEMQA